jgi:hypothetical protein
MCRMPVPLWRMARIAFTLAASVSSVPSGRAVAIGFVDLAERIRCLPRPATLGFVRRGGDAVSKLDWAGDGAERLEAFAGAKDRHVAIVEHAPED